jgi:site-specific DNA-methyltransferase (adenine-specific)
MELRTLCRKPLDEKTIAKNVLKHWTGGINIDECRVGSEIIKTHWKWTQNGNTPIVPQSIDFVWWTRVWRFPANLIHDWSDEVVDLFPDSKWWAFPKTHWSSWFVSPEVKEKRVELGDSWSASRFFYCAKASKSERNKGLDGLVILKDWVDIETINKIKEALEI